VPFTVTIDEAPGRFRSVSLYIRAANQGEDSSAVKERAERQRLVGFELGQLPVFVPERATAATADGATFLAGEEFVGETAPTEFTPDTLPQGFDYEAAGRQIFASQMLPLGNFSEGGYRLEVIVSDNLAERSTARSLQFIIQPGAPSL
jgi:hypothetical protein